MDSNELKVETVQSSTELKHLGFLKEIAVKFLVILSNAYDFAKENTGDLKTTVVLAENAVVSIVGPVYEKVKYLPEQIIVFVDAKFDKYAPSIAQKLVAKVESLISKTTPLVQKLLTTTQAVIMPLISTAVSLLQRLLQTIKSSPLVNKAQTLLKKGLTATQTLVKSLPLVATTQSLLQNSLNTTKSAVKDTIFQKGPDLANQAIDTTKSLVGNIPLVGNAAQSLITNPVDLANQVVNTTNSLVNENPIIGAAKNMVKEAQSTGMKATLQAAYISFKLVGVPIIAQFWYKVTKYPLVATLSEFFLPVVEYLSEWYNKVYEYMDGKGYSITGYLPSLPIDEMKAAYKLVKTSMDGLSAVGDLIGVNDN